MLEIKNELNQERQKIKNTSSVNKIKKINQIKSQQINQQNLKMKYTQDKYGEPNEITVKNLKTFNISKNKFKVYLQKNKQLLLIIFCNNQSIISFIFFFKNMEQIYGNLINQLQVDIKSKLII
ncbi:transmembrane protein, putative (macronuclear) [Tetrahymena thermophila SB210]|uniref:Transmembrane protein, putative n=1 Tax=Tetrahymena thermophila (strain SB210) TaxID=312017 RepID=W7X3Q7_TETTS|nr:transmembrane protein, putative [Tetrahymena thermophila SB210]EWS73945.1 transmembrane protein, putative [Tetrahymena thermophila SB210]|eukprot:XP_012653526.1 transmembrane protein, putative [Tetrahymena thermophila SB210]